jgi:hypothetical protein
MARNYPRFLASTPHRRSIQTRREGRLPTSKNLDLLILAGCSCLMTVLYHPVAEALQTPSIGASSRTAITTQTSKPTSNPMNAFHLTLLSNRDETLEDSEDRSS